MNNPISEIGRVRHRLRTGLTVWLFLSAIGIGIVVIPDYGPRLFSLSETHHVTLVDSIGIVVLVVGWVTYLLPFWRQRKSLMQRKVWGSLALVGAGVIAWSVLTDAGAWWAAGILILVLAQIVPGLALLGEARRYRGPSLR